MLTKRGYGEWMQRLTPSIRAFSAIALSTIALSSCSDDSSVAGKDGITVVPDPLVARTLNDPLMVDPDLAHRNEANALLTVRHDHALPPLISSSETAEQAREAARRELVDSGSIRDLPPSQGEYEGEPLALGMTASDIIKASGAPSACNGKLEEGLVWAARVPEVAKVMPHGMAMQAAGADGEGCQMRIVRYVTPAGVEDALQYHFNRADRAKMKAVRHREPEAILDAARGSEHLKVYARPSSNGTSAVDLVYWKR